MVSVTHAAHEIEVTAESLQEDLARLEVQKQALERELAAVKAHLGSVQRALGALQTLMSAAGSAPPVAVGATGTYETGGATRVEPDGSRPRRLPSTRPRPPTRRAVSRSTANSPSRSWTTSPEPVTPTSGHASRRGARPCHGQRQHQRRAQHSRPPGRHVPDPPRGPGSVPRRVNPRRRGAHGARTRQRRRPQRSRPPHGSAAGTAPLTPLIQRATIRTLRAGDRLPPHDVVTRCTMVATVQVCATIHTVYSVACQLACSTPCRPLLYGRL
ncbi:hypothetical protein SAMN05444521_8489 [Streptomyces sp. 3214.6]|nr:hypothetical protein SAMN05444521_8489 [Streptomyces sp. 3214.6]